MPARQELVRLVEQNRKNPMALECLHERLRVATDRRDRQQLLHAIRHCERTANGAEQKHSEAALDAMIKL